MASGGRKLVVGGSEGSRLEGSWRVVRSGSVVIASRLQPDVGGNAFPFVGVPPVISVDSLSDQQPVQIGR